MWRVVCVCPKCMGGEFEKTEDGTFICNECEREYDSQDLDIIDIQE